jgi:hypothetical protein
MKNVISALYCPNTIAIYVIALKDTEEFGFFFGQTGEFFFLSNTPHPLLKMQPTPKKMCYTKLGER